MYVEKRTRTQSDPGSIPGASTKSSNTKNGGKMIYLVRHGQTNWNIQHRLQGQTDVELNQTGIKQAKVLAQKLSKIKFDICFASPLKRAFKTAQIIYQGKIILDRRIVERGAGELEGRTDWKQLQQQLGIDVNHPHESRLGIEPLNDMKRRLSSFWNEILEKYPDDNVLVVTHAGVVKGTQIYFYGMPENNDLSKYRLDNCAILTIDNHKLPKQPGFDDMEA